MTRTEKNQVIEELKDKISNNTHFYVTDASGLSVAQVNRFRGMCFEKGVDYKVYKNTLIKKALEHFDADFSALEESALKGFSGIMFSEESGKTPASIIKEFRKNGSKPILKGASIDFDLFIGDDQLDNLAKLKSKAELIGEVITLLQSPAKNVVSSLQSGGGKIAGILQTLSERENSN